MGMKEKQVGGSGTGIGQDFATFLQQGLNTGTYGAGTPAGYGAAGSTNGIAGVLNDILSGGAGHVGGALQQLLQTQQSNDIGNLRARFGAGGGTAFGTPGQYAESTYRAQAAPQITSAIGNLQLSALLPLLGMTGQIAGKDIPQAETTLQQSPWMQAAGLALPVAGGILGGPLGASIGSGLGSLFGHGGGVGNLTGGFPQLSGLGPNAFNPSLGGALSGGFMPVNRNPMQFNPLWSY